MGEEISAQFHSLEQVHAACNWLQDASCKQLIAS